MNSSENMSVRFPAVLLICAAVSAGDWPTYQHDSLRSGKTDERLETVGLGAVWTYRSSLPPQPAWPGPARWDAYARIRGLRSLRNYDPVFHTAIARGRVYFSSNADDSVYCLDAKTGTVEWSFCTDGPVRSAPTVSGEKVYFGSDDGNAYCLSAESGKLIWSFNPNPDHRLVIHNGRLISFWPCRTGVAVRDGTAYFGHSLLPWKESYLCAVNAETGKPDGDGRYVQRLKSQTMEGAILASGQRLVLPQGRVAPLLFSRLTGKPAGGLKGGGGSFVLLAEDDTVIHGPGTPKKGNNIITSNATTRETIATSRGNAMIVADTLAYILNDTTLTCFDRANKKNLWRAPCDVPLALILAGDILIAGGAGKVSAFRTSDGRRVWSSSVHGNAFGLAASDGALYVSTDEGRIYCFRKGGKKIVIEKKQNPREESVEETTQPVELAPIPKVKEEGLQHRWVFQQPAAGGSDVRNLAADGKAQILGNPRLHAAGKIQSLALDGKTSVMVANHFKKIPHPTRTITAEAWVQVNQPLQWGGLAGIIQDNGDYERGWILGFSGSFFSFAVCGKEGPGRLTYLKAKSAFKPHTWYYVAGTYDGKEMRVYVNGKLESASPAQKGDINYPPQAFFELAAYHDKDEYFRAVGLLREVRIYNTALSEAEIQNHFKEGVKLLPAGQQPLELALGPVHEFETHNSAVVRWQTHKPMPTSLNWSDNEDQWTFKDPSKKTSHEVRLTDLRRNRLYRYSIRNTHTDFELDTHFNFKSGTDLESTPNDAELANIAAEIIRTTQVKKGICVDLDAGDGSLAIELIRGTDLRVICFEQDRARMEEARNRFKKAGIYGSRVTVHHASRLQHLPKRFANLVLSQASPKSEKQRFDASLLDILRPSGGIALVPTEASGVAARKLGLKVVTVNSAALPGMNKVIRPPLARTGEWSHLYGSADNSAFGGESLSGARKSEDMDVQWLGHPGPRNQADRNGRKPAPLATNGRLFIQGLHRIIAIDAYNGTVLWTLGLPNFERFNMPRDCSNWCADDDHIYAAIRGRCWVINAADGRTLKQIDVVPDSRKSWAFDWGYIASQNKLLIGSAVKKNSAYTNFWGGGSEGWYDSKKGPVNSKVCSDNLFAVQKADGRKVWAYQNGLVINPTITIADGKVFFVEIRNEKTVASQSRRVGMIEMWQDQFLVALDVSTGRKIWEEAIDTPDGEVTFYMAYGGGKLVICGSRPEGKKGHYSLDAFSAANGGPAWQTTFEWPNEGHHGSHMSRPAIVGNLVAVRPRTFRLDTGEPLPGNMPGGGCGTYAVTEHAFLFRAGTITMWDFKGGKTSKWNRLRPDCWISTIPAGGMLLSPEGGGGCSCGNWMETSVGFIPKLRK